MPFAWTRAAAPTLRWRVTSGQITSLHSAFRDRRNAKIAQSGCAPAGSYAHRALETAASLSAASTRATCAIRRTRRLHSADRWATALAAGTQCRRSRGYARSFMSPTHARPTGKSALPASAVHPRASHASRRATDTRGASASAPIQLRHPNGSASTRAASMTRRRLTPDSCFRSTIRARRAPAHLIMASAPSLAAVRRPAILVTSMALILPCACLLVPARHFGRIRATLRAP